MNRQSYSYMEATRKAPEAATSESFMNLLRRHRISRGLNQTDLAKKLGVVPSTVSFWESGDSIPAPKLIPKLARILGIGPMELTRVISPDATNPGALAK